MDGKVDPGYRFSYEKRKEVDSRTGGGKCSPYFRRGSGEEGQKESEVFATPRDGEEGVLEINKTLLLQESVTMHRGNMLILRNH